MCLVTAALSAVAYLLQSYQIKSKHLGKIFLRLPSLEALDKLHSTPLFLGVVLFTLGILSGLIWAKQLREWNEVLKDPTALSSFLACFLYWIILAVRLSALRRGQKIAVGTVLIFVLLFFSLIGSSYCPLGFHKGL